MHKYFINQHGVQTYTHPNGVYFIYPISNNVIAETSLESLKMALETFKVESLDDISGIDIIENNINL